jgi:hypothetical protein
MSTPVPVPVPCQCQYCSKSEMRLWCGNCSNAGMDRHGSASPPRSLFSRVQEPTVQSRARRARDSRLERGGSGWRREVEAKSRLQLCKGSRQYPIKIRNPEFQGPAGSSACQLWLITIFPRLLVAHAVAGSRHLGRNRQAENQRSRQPQSKYGHPCL